jgi:hypothetical protein
MKNRQAKFGRWGLAALLVGFSLASEIAHAGSDVQAYKCNEIAGGSYHLMAFNGDGTLFEAAILTNSNGGTTVAVPYMGSYRMSQGKLVTHMAHTVFPGSLVGQSESLTPIDLTTAFSMRGSAQSFDLIGIESYDAKSRKRKSDTDETLSCVRAADVDGFAKDVFARLPKVIFYVQ